MNEKSAGADFTPLTVTLRGGRVVTLRQIRPDDGEALQAALRGMSAESRYLRFMSALNQLSPAMLDYAVNPVAGRDLALVAVAAATGGGAEAKIVGGARYIADAAGQSCEFAIALGDDWRGSGLASHLMRELIRSARARGLKNMEGFVLAHNAPMRKLAKRLGFEVTASSEGPDVLRARLDLCAGAAERAPGER